MQRSPEEILRDLEARTELSRRYGFPNTQIGHAHAGQLAVLLRRFLYPRETMGELTASGFKAGPLPPVWERGGW